MNKAEKYWELVTMVDELLESLFYNDEWWKKENPLSAETFLNDYLDKKTGIVYNALDWFNLSEDEKEDFVRGTIEELTPIFIDAREIAQRMFKVYKKCFELGMEVGYYYHFDDWPFLGNDMVTGFEIGREGKIKFIAEDTENPLVSYITQPKSKEEYISMVSFLENEFLAQ